MRIKPMYNDYVKLWSVPNPDKMHMSGVEKMNEKAVGSH